MASSKVGTGAHVARDQGRVARARVRPGQCAAAQPAVGRAEVRGLISFDDGADLHVAQLPDVVVAAIAALSSSRGRCRSPPASGAARQRPARRGSRAGSARIGLEHRRPCFLDLQEQRVIVGGHEQRDEAQRADAADADDFHRQVAQAGSGRTARARARPATRDSVPALRWYWSASPAPVPRCG